MTSRPRDICTVLSNTRVGATWLFLCALCVTSLISVIFSYLSGFRRACPSPFIKQMGVRLTSQSTVEVRCRNGTLILRLEKRANAEIVDAIEVTQGCVCVGLRDARIAVVRATNSLTIPAHLFHGAALPIGQFLSFVDADSLVALGTHAWVSLDENRNVRRRVGWENRSDAIARIVALPDGKLRDAVAQNACIAVDISGNVYVAQRASILATNQGNHTIITRMEQPPAGVIVAKDAHIAVVVGQLNAVVAIYTHDRAIRAAYAALPGSHACIQTAQLRLDALPDGRVRVRDTRDNSYLVVAWDNAKNVVSFERDTPHVDTTGNALTKVLHGIEDASDLLEAVEERARRAEARLVSLNNALLFALQSRGADAVKCVEAHFSAALHPAPHSASFYTAPTCVGVNAFIQVKLHNRSTIAIGDECILRLTIEDSVAQHSSIPSFATQLSLACPSLPASAHAIVSFPVNIQSHAPLHVSLDLILHIPRARPLHINIAKKRLLDVLHFSQPVSTSPAPDVAHRRLRITRINAALHPDRPPPRDPLPLTARLELPVASDKLRDILPQRHCSFLGANFSIDLVQHLVTIRAAPAVLPFLRAAVLRRATAFAVDINAPDQQSARRWERGIVDAADNALSTLRDAEQATVEIHALASAVENGAVHLCANGEDIDTVRKTFSQLDSATQKWRLGIQHVWNPSHASVQ